MQWSDEAIVLSAHSHGESGHIVQLFTPAQGRHAGLVKGRKILSQLQSGNKIHATWKARLSEHLGMLQVELVRPYAALVMETQAKLSALTAACSLIETSFPERDPHPEMYVMLEQLLDKLASGQAWQRTYIDFEHLLLIELGYGLDLSECASTGARENLIYVSPKSGRAVSADAGEPYKDKLLKLPGFLIQQQSATIEDLIDSLKITGYFLEKHREHIAHRPLPSARARLMQIMN
jgi:DNA repair protein RecO (recombination protein O)